MNEEKKLIWSSKEEQQAWDELARKIDDRLGKAMWGIPIEDTRTEEKKYEDRLKYAYVRIGEGREMVMAHEDTLEAYKLRTDIPDLIYPLERVIYDKFDRWCTSFDL